MNLKTAKEVIEELQATTKLHMSSEERMNLKVLLLEYDLDDIIEKEIIEL